MSASISVCSDITRVHAAVPADHKHWAFFSFAVIYSDPIAHFSKRPEDPPWHNKHNRTDIAEFGPMPTQFWFTMAQLYLEVNEFSLCCYRAVIGKMGPFVPITVLHVSRALAKLGFLGRIGHSKFERLLIVLGHWIWPLRYSVRYFIFFNTNILALSLIQ